jgi:beta-lactam-binding protein with PASTA domain
MTIAAALLFILAGITVTLIVLTWAGERFHKVDVLLELAEAEAEAEAEAAELYVPIDPEPYAPEHSSHLRGQRTRRIDPAAVKRAARHE